MRLDNGIAYVVTGIFVAAMLEQRLGGSVRLLFLIGFLSAAATSLLGVWNGVSLLFADFVRVARGASEEQTDAYVSEPSRDPRSSSIPCRPSVHWPIGHDQNNASASNQ